MGKKEETKHFFMQAHMVDIISPVMHMFERFGWKIVDNKIVYTIHPQFDNGWYQSVKAEDRPNCLRWLQIFFNIYNIIPKPCFDCFKVVVAPRTLEELMRIKAMQERMGFPSKCGIEKRQYVTRNYGAYWYAPHGKGLDAARNLRKEVEEQLHLEFGKDIPKIILKRGCTEMERGWGPSNKWKYDRYHSMMFDLLEQSYAYIDNQIEEPTLKWPVTLQLWIQRAAEQGDLTYLKYSDILIPSPVDYTTENHGVEEKLIEVVGG